MASNIHISVACRNAMLEAIDTTIAASGKLKIYGDTQPTDADTSLGAQTLLATCPLSADGFATASGGNMSANTITDDSSADATETANWGTLTTSADVRVVDFSVGEAADSPDLTLNNKSIQSGATVSITSFQFTTAA